MPQTLFTAFSVLLGLALGSFGAAFAFRWLHELSMVRPARSLCPSCEHPLSWRENIPLASFALQRGRCRHCSARIHWRYPATELALAVWAALVALTFGPGVEWGVYLLMGALLITASVIDLESFLLPDVLTIPGTVLALLAATFLLGQGPHLDRFTDALMGLAVGGGVFYLLHLGYRLLRGAEGLGLGDVKLMCLIGALCGPQSLPFVILVGAVSALAASAFWLVKSSDGARTPVPFGPFLAFAALAWIITGPEVWGWYLSVMR